MRKLDRFSIEEDAHKSPDKLQLKGAMAVINEVLGEYGITEYLHITNSVESVRYINSQDKTLALGPNEFLSHFVISKDGEDVIAVGFDEFEDTVYYVVE